MTQVNLQDLFQQYQREDAIEVVPAGTYQLEVLRATVRNGNKGQGVLPVYKVLSGPYAGKTVMAGQFTASPDGRSIFFRQMAGFGLDAAFFATVGSMEDVANALKGRIIEAQITVRPWQGQDRNNIAIGGIKLLQAGGSDPIAAQFTQPPAPQAPPPAPAQIQSTPPQAQVAFQQPPAAATTVEQELAISPPPVTSAVPPMPPIPTANGSGPGF